MSFAVLAVSDLLFQSRIQAALDARGVAVRVPHSDAACVALLADRPLLFVVDLQEEMFDAPRLITNAKAGGAAVLAFGRHTAPEPLRAARAAGADCAVARSQVAEELADLLDELIGGRSAPVVRDSG